ncbi:MAG: alpha/beta hydrolase, partial [bacterium]|nr:alpha/beta hydrolase [bacterium]
MCLGVAFGALLAFTPTTAALEPQSRGLVELEPCPVPGTDDGEMLCGSLDVFENRDTRKGRVISLAIAVVPALSSNPRPDPIFWLAGGPGGAATASAAWFHASWMRSDRDVVLVDLRGTGGSNPLACGIPENTEDLQNYLRGSFEELGAIRRCKRQLKEVANLRLYTTPIAIDELDDVRAAMGYGRINLFAGSWGTRNTLIYLRRHPGRVRRAILNGAAPLGLIYPLHIADAAQRTLDLILDQCARDVDCAAAFPGMDQEFQAVLDRLEQAPEPVTIEHPDTGEPVVVEFPHTGLGEAVRYLMRNR